MSARARYGRPAFDGWTLALPDDGSGWVHLVPSTYAQTRAGCWSLSFGWLANHLESDWSDRFWKRWSESMADARRRGYRMVRVRLTVDERETR